MPNSVIHNRKEVINLTLGTNDIGNLLSNWHISDEPSLSDYRYVFFQIGNTAITRVTFRDSKELIGTCTKMTHK
jgi:hypothetical protein